MDVARPQEEVPTAAAEIERNTPAKYPTAAHDDGHGVRASPAPVHCSKYLQDPNEASKIQARNIRLLVHTVDDIECISRCATTKRLRKV